MRGVEWPFTVGTVGSMILGPNPNRVSLRFSGDGAKTITISTDGVPVSGQGLVLTATNPVADLTYDQIGNRIRQPIYAIASGAGALLTVYEGFL